VPAANAKFKAELKAAGLWVDFTTRRDELKGQGLHPREAAAQATEEIQFRLDKWKADNPDAMSSPSSDGKAEVPPDSDCCPDKEEPHFDAEAYAEFMAKECDIVEAIQWVAKNLETPSSVTAMDAPSAEAWGMLQNYSFSPSRKFDFWDKVFTKLIPSRATIENNTNVSVDGANVIDACDRLVGIKAGAEA